MEKGEMLISSDTNKSRIIRLAAIPFSSSTAATGVTAPLYALNTAEVKDIEAHAEQIKGHWLLIPTSLMRTADDIFKEFLDTPLLFAAAKKAGAAGVLRLSNRPGRLLYRRSASLNGTIVPLPAALIEREGGEYMIQKLKSGIPITFKATLNNIIQEKPLNYNVIAEIHGTEKSNEVIVLGAHLDSWDLGQGALDNGVNAVMVMDVARQVFALKQLGFYPRRTIRFVLYSGEEFGLYGSWYDVKNHPKMIDSIKVVIIYDAGSGRTTGFSLGGRADMVNLINRVLQPLKSLGPFTQTTDASFGTDNFDYLLKGIPTLVANQDITSYLPYYHAETDTLDKVDQRELKLNMVIAAVLTWNLANTEEPIPRRQTKNEINQLLKSTGLKKQMDIFQVENHQLS
ncbi:MAG TPA: M28 family peptidase, partial [Legionellaceae bacterium]|nr:M28 family peptidase [Legionellaceae bacterium]